MSKIKLYKNSPLNVLGGRLQNILKYQDIAQAGAPQSLTGRAVMELGRLFTQMDMGEKEEEEEEETPNNERTDLERLQLFADGQGLDYSDATKSYLAPTKLPEIGTLNPRLPVQPIIKPNTMVGGLEWEIGKNATYDGRVVDRPLTESDTTGSTTITKPTEPKLPAVDLKNLLYNFSRGKATKDQKAAYEDYKINGRINESLLPTAQSSEQQPQKQVFTKEYIESLKRNFSAGKTKKSQRAAYDNYKKTGEIDTSLLNRLNSPVDRLSPMNRLDLQALDSDTANLLEGLRYRRKGADNSPLHRAAHVSMSPFLDTESASKIDYRYMKRATTPEYFAKTDGLAGSAAAGYNLVIDKANYNAAVKKDYEEEVTNAMGSLDVAPDLVKNDFTKDYFNLAAEYKAEYAGYHKQYANGDMTKIELEARRTNLSTKLSQIADAGKNLQTLRSEYLKNKSSYDVDASDTKMVDFYNTLEHDPNNLSVKQIDGVTYMVGKTKQGKGIKVPASKIADGTAGFRLVEKVDLTPLVTDALGTIQKYTEEGATKYGTGVKNADPVKAKKMAMASIMASLRGDENNLRSLMAQVYGVDHDTYQNFLGDDPKENRQEILRDAAEHLYETQVKPQYFPKSKTSRFTDSNNGKSSQSERKVAKLTNQLNNLPDPSADNINEYASLFDPTKLVIRQDDDGWFIGDIKNDSRVPLDLNDPVATKRKIAAYAGVKGYGLGNNKSNQTDLSQYNFDL